uniref:Uncharacterized protein n=1 Tax=Romanomermis culicivorax TaxID=13658 RepID=A0A915ILT7_ROMCU
MHEFLSDKNVFVDVLYLHEHPSPDNQVELRSCRRKTNSWEILAKDVHMFSIGTEVGPTAKRIPTGQVSMQS